MSGNGSSKTPPQCTQAIKRLEVAIARLERAAQHAAPSQGQAPRIAQLEGELDQMRKLTQSVTERLDQSIGRIRVALEN